MFNKSKYGSVLTVILIISIIAILGLVGIGGYRLYNKYYITQGGSEAVDAFENAVQSNNPTETANPATQQNIAGDTNIALTGIDNTYSDSSSSGGTTKTGNKTTYRGFDVIGTIQIPTINLKYPILEQNTKKSLETSVVLMYSSNGVNEVGNTVIIGHNYRNGTMFSNVKKLSNGDAIYITDTLGRKIKYTVYSIYRTSGSDSKYITRNTKGKREISLSTCTDDSKARTIVLARES